MVKIREDMTGWKMWEHGVPDSCLVVIERADDYIYPNGHCETQWLCECNCKLHNKIIVTQGHLKSGHTLSCGCLQKTRASLANKESNIIIDKDDYCVGFTSNTGAEFYFDLIDKPLVEKYCWGEFVQKDGYHVLRAYIPEMKKMMKMAHILGFKKYDHIDRNPLNNRRNNFRICSNSQNAQNRSKGKNNTSGVTGVCWNKTHQLWVVRVSSNGKQICIGYFLNKEDAIKARLLAEVEYYGEFAPQKHLFEEYGIEVNNNE